MSEEADVQAQAFAVDRRYVTEPVKHGIPVIAFEDLPTLHAPDSVRLVNGFGYQAINGLRAARYEQAKGWGYQFVTFVSRRSWVAPGVTLGEATSILDARVAPFCQIGVNCSIGPGSLLSHNCNVGNHVYTSIGVAIGGNVHIGDRVFLGVGAIVRDGVSIGERCLIGAGAVVISDTEPGMVYAGNPARKTGKTALEATGGR